MISGLRSAIVLIWLAGFGIAAAVGTCRAGEGLHASYSDPARMEESRESIILQHSEPAYFIDNMVARLWRHARSEMPPVKVHLVQDAVADARSYPDGAIFLTTGMIAHTRNEHQLALVLAHEITHYTRRHAQMVSDSVLSATHRFFHLADEAELEADREGLSLMRRSGYCPQAGVTLMTAFPDGLERWSRATDMLDPADEIACRTGTQSDQGYSFHVAPALLADAWSAVAKGMWRQASEDIKRYLSVRPDDPWAHYLNGEIAYRWRRQTDQAIGSYQKALDLDRSFVPAHRALGFIHFKAGDLKSARRFFETSLALSPHADDNDYIRSYLQLCSE